MIFIEKESRGRNQKRLNFVLTEIENAGSPTFMFAQALVRILVTTSAVEHIKSVLVLGKMRRNPVENYADARFVALVHKIHKIVRSAETRRYRKITRYLISPAAVERKLGYRHKFHVRVVHLFKIRHEFACVFAIGVIIVVFVTFPTA